MRVRHYSKGKRTWKQGKFTPTNIRKYTGKWPIRFLSSWELKFMKWLDQNDRILEWTSESHVIRYFNPIKERMCNYFPDFSFVTNEHKKFLIEVKPYKETHAPQLNKFKKIKSRDYAKKTWLMNQAKWEAANKWSQEFGYKFKILTEKELFKGFH